MLSTASLSFCDPPGEKQKKSNAPRLKNFVQFILGNFVEPESNKEIALIKDGAYYC